MPDYRFTQDWFSVLIPSWQEIWKPLAGKENVQVLEIGSYEGRSSVWLLENIVTHPSSQLWCVDTWESATEELGDFKQAEANFHHNIEQSGGRRRVWYEKSTSRDFLRKSWPLKILDAAYIDGSHFTPDVLLDLTMTWPFIKVGGFMLCDDYTMGTIDPTNVCPRRAIDAFLDCNQWNASPTGWCNCANVEGTPPRQVLIRKTRDVP